MVEKELIEKVINAVFYLLKDFVEFRKNQLEEDISRSNNSSRQGTDELANDLSEAIETDNDYKKINFLTEPNEPENLKKELDSFEKKRKEFKKIFKVGHQLRGEFEDFRDKSVSLVLFFYLREMFQKGRELHGVTNTPEGWEKLKSFESFELLEEFLEGTEWMTT